MKVVILCGGQGTRLREETEYKPKALVMVGDKPILWHIMKLYSHYGYNDFVLCLGYKGEMIKNYFLNYNALNHDFTLRLGSGEKELHGNQNGVPQWNITFADTGEECETGSRIARIKKYLGSDSEFLLTYGDAVANVNIAELVKYHREKGKHATVTAIRPPNPFGVIKLENGLANTFIEKPQLRDWANGGFLVCNTKIFQHLSDDGSCVFEERPLQVLARSGELAVYNHNSFWHCVDTLKHLEGLNALYNRGERPWEVWRS